ncbi:MAG: hypothetical protein GY906_22715 [bacterium]|nr:hypothetical protein [bacterium]
MKLWLGFSEGKPSFYTDPDYYDGVLKADLFRSRKAGRKCYEDLRRVEVTVIDDSTGDSG